MSLKGPTTWRRGDQKSRCALCRLRLGGKGKGTHWVGETKTPFSTRNGALTKPVEIRLCDECAEPLRKA